MHLSLLALSLTRDKVIELSKFIAKTNMLKEAFERLTEQKFEDFYLSQIILNVIRKKFSNA